MASLVQGRLGTGLGLPIGQESSRVVSVVLRRAAPFPLTASSGPINRSLSDIEMSDDRDDTVVGTSTICGYLDRRGGV